MVRVPPVKPHRRRDNLLHLTRVTHGKERTCLVWVSRREREKEKRAERQERKGNESERRGERGEDRRGEDRRGQERRGQDRRGEERRGRGFASNLLKR
eukprot:768394-Hanusia_phi.AAC.6